MALYTITISRAHTDNPTDDPRQARQEIDKGLQALQQILLNAGVCAEQDVGAGLEADSGSLKVNLTSSQSVTMDFGSLT